MVVSSSAPASLECARPAPLLDTSLCFKSVPYEAGRPSKCSLQRGHAVERLETRARHAPHRNRLEIFKRTNPVEINRALTTRNRSKIAFAIPSSGEESLCRLSPRVANLPTTDTTRKDAGIKRPIPKKHAPSGPTQPVICFGGEILVFRIAGVIQRRTDFRYTGAKKAVKFMSA
jgi:hypothetical protein